MRGASDSPLMPCASFRFKCAFSDDSRRFAVAEERGTIRVWQRGTHMPSDSRVATDSVLPSSVRSRLITPGTGSFSAMDHPLDSKASSLLAKLPVVPKGTQRTCVFSPDGSRGLTLSQADTMRDFTASLWGFGILLARVRPSPSISFENRPGCRVHMAEEKAGSSGALRSLAAQPNRPAWFRRIERFFRL